MFKKLSGLSLRCAALAAAAWLGLAAPASAALVTASYTGTVSGLFEAPFNQTPGTDYPVGTAVSWQFTLDDAFLGVLVADVGVGGVGSAANQATSGTLRLGSDTWALNFARLWGGWTDAAGEFSSYWFRIEGTGPTTAGGGSLYGLLLSWTPTLDLLSDAIGFTYPGFGYLETEGSYRLDRPQAVPIPATAWLVLPALSWLMLRRPRRR
jgi:hypothetical protein